MFTLHRMDGKRRTIYKNVYHNTKHEIFVANKMNTENDYYQSVTIRRSTSTSISLLWVYSICALTVSAVCSVRTHPMYIILYKLTTTCRQFKLILIPFSFRHCRVLSVGIRSSVRYIYIWMATPNVYMPCSFIFFSSLLEYTLVD